MFDLNDRQRCESERHTHKNGNTAINGKSFHVLQMIRKINMEEGEAKSIHLFVLKMTVIKTSWKIVVNLSLNSLRVL